MGDGKDAKKAEMQQGCVTRRLGCVGLDWGRVSMKDLFKIFDSLLPHSPPISVNLYKTKAGRKELGDSNVFVRTGARISEWYIAVAEFRDVDDSISIYSSCDGNELERSGMYFDLRFISDGVVLGNPCDEASGCSGYESKQFVRKSSIDLEDEDDSVEAELGKLFDQKEIDVDAVHRFVDISDDETERTPLLFPTASAETDMSEAHAEEGSDGEDFNEAYGLLPGKGRGRKEVVIRERDKNKICISEAMGGGKAEEECEGFVFNPRDERFGEVLENDDFAIDPTHPEYKKKSGMREILEEKRKRFKNELD